MAKFEGISCDGPNCKKTKGDANKWLIGQRISASHQLGLFWGYAIGAWDDALADACQHFCGQTCALARQNEFLESQQKEATH